MKIHPFKFYKYIAAIILLFVIAIVPMIRNEAVSILASIFRCSKSCVTIGYLTFLGLFISFFTHRFIIRLSMTKDVLIDDHTSNKPQLFHERPTPRAGGIGIYMTNFLLLINYSLGWKFVLAAFPAFLGGLLDDLKYLSPKTRLLFQSFSAIMAIFLLDSVIDSIGFGIEIPYILGVVLTIVAITGVINAINIIDGFNGLASGFSLMAFASIAYVSYQVGDITILEIALINIAALIGFLTLNFPKGKIFLGDGGAYFLGFALATLTLLLHHKHPNEVSQWYPLALLIYPVFEIGYSIYRRKFLEKKEATKHDNNHFHQLIYKNMTKSNPKTSLYIFARVLPFIFISSFFHSSDLIEIGGIITFGIFYLIAYKKIIRLGSI